MTVIVEDPRRDLVKWYRARSAYGDCTASNVGFILGFHEGGYETSLAKLYQQSRQTLNCMSLLERTYLGNTSSVLDEATINQALDRFTGRTPNFVMELGKKREPAVAAEYLRSTLFNPLTEHHRVGRLWKARYSELLATPDLEIFPKWDAPNFDSPPSRVVELKAPWGRPTHIKHQYWWQCQIQMLCCEVDVCDFYSLCMGSKKDPSHTLYTARIRRCPEALMAALPYLEFYMYLATKLNEIQTPREEDHASPKDQPVYWETLEIDDHGGSTAEECWSQFVHASSTPNCTFDQLVQWKKDSIEFSYVRK